MENLEKFERLFKESLEKLPKTDVAIAFSGGLDSSTMAKMMLNLGFKFKGYVAGMKNSTDIVQAKKVAAEIRLPLEIIELTEKDVESAIPVQYSILKDLYEKNNKNTALDPNPVPISFNLPLYFVFKKAKEKNIFLAQGPDEMLGGYTRHTKMEKEKALQEMKNNLDNFLKYGAEQNIATGKHFNKQVFMPFLDKTVIDFCLSLPYNLRINEEKRKYILRQLAIKIGLSKETAMKNKKAAQYGSGIIWEMKRLAKQKNVHISKYVVS